MMSIFHTVSHECSKIVTTNYSTSFAGSIKLLHKDLRQPIHNIYGFVRFADEIVDTFHSYDKRILLEEFEQETWKAVRNGISLNPILHSFQETVNAYSIPHKLIDAFLNSMKADLLKSNYRTSEEMNEYIYGSAEVVGLMCLCIFCEGNIDKYAELKPFAQKLGAAFQKINFLRDLKADFNTLNRSYFPNFDISCFNEMQKQEIEKDIESDLKYALGGIRKLPWKARLGVYTAYMYYYALFRKIKKMNPGRILQERIRVPDYKKALILLTAGVNNRFNLI